MAKKKLYEIEYFAVSDIGKFRLNHEDNFLLPTGDLLIENQIDKINPRVLFEGNLKPKFKNALHFAVADGMGGHKAGEIASSIVVNELKRRFFKWRPATMDKAVEEYKKFIFELNSAVHAFGKTSNDYYNLGSTLASLIFCKNKIVSVNVGDSRVYSFTDGVLRRLSKDHTEGQMLIDIGIINNEDNNLYKVRNSLTRHIGMSDVDFDALNYISSEQEVSDSDIFLICSDGLTCIVNEEQISKIMGEGKAKGLSLIGNELLETCLDSNFSEKAGCDNITIILFKVLIKDKTKKFWRNFFNKFKLGFRKT